MRWDISVVAAGRDLDVICARDKIVRGIEPAPTVRRGERFDPGMRCASAARRAARGGDGVSADVPRGDPDRAAQPEQQMREVLANAARFAENFDDGRFDGRDAGDVFEALVHQMHEALRRGERVVRRCRTMRPGEGFELGDQRNERRWIEEVRESRRPERIRRLRWDREGVGKERLDLTCRAKLQMPVSARQRHEETGVAEAVAVAADRAGGVDGDVESTPALMRVAARP